MNIAQNFCDPCPEQHSIQSESQIARGLGDSGLDAGNVEFAVLDLDSVEFSPAGAMASVTGPPR